MKTTEITGKSLKERRLKEGLSQPEVAWRVGCSRSFISHIENGRADNKPLSLAKVDAALRGLPIPEQEIYPFKDEAERELLHRIWIDKWV